MDEKKNEQKILDHGLNPSSEWRFHQDIYINKPDAIAIVHAHSPHATAVSAHGKNIPAFHYMVALAGLKDHTLSLLGQLELLSQKKIPSEVCVTFLNLRVIFLG